MLAVIKMSSRLHLAVKEGKWEQVVDLIAHGADIFAKDINNLEPIEFADRASDDVYLKLLIPADTSDARFGGDRLFHVIKHRRWNFVPIVLKHGASLNDQDQMGYTPLHYVLLELKVPSESDVHIVQKFISSDNINTPNRNGSTPLHMASELLQWHLIPVLLQKGADVNLCDNFKCTPLLSAFELFKKRGTYEYLKKNPLVLPNFLKGYFESPILMPLLDKPENTLKLLLSHENINIRNKFGEGIVSLVHCHRIWGLLPALQKLDTDFSELREVDIKAEKTGQPQSNQPATLKQLATSVVRTHLCSLNHSQLEVVPDLNDKLQNVRTFPLLVPDWLRRELPAEVVTYLQLYHDVAERMVAELM